MFIFMIYVYLKGNVMAAPESKRNRTNSLKAFKRQHILAAARRIFDEKGIDGLNMRAIAQEAGYSLGAAYAYFGTKEEIELELMAGILGDLTRHTKIHRVTSKKDTVRSGAAGLLINSPPIS